MNWDEYFMRMVYLAASKSKDPRTRIGAIAVDDKQTVVATGFNGICRGVFDPADIARYEILAGKQAGLSFEEFDRVKAYREIKSSLADRQERPTKYLYYEHAERNVCYAAARNGVALDGATVYTNGVPCCDCARAMIQSGIRVIKVHHQWPMNGVTKSEGSGGWKDSLAVSIQMLNEAGVEIECIDIELGIIGFVDGKEVSV